MELLLSVYESCPKSLGFGLADVRSVSDLHVFYRFVKQEIVGACIRMGPREASQAVPRYGLWCLEADWPREGVG